MDASVHTDERESEAPAGARDGRRLQAVILILLAVACVARFAHHYYAVVDYDDITRPPGRRRR